MILYYQKCSNRRKNLPYTINIARFTYFYYKICEEGKEYSDKDLYEYLNNSKEKCEFEEAYSLLIEAELYQSIKQEVYKSYINVYLTDKITSIEDLLKHIISPKKLKNTMYSKINTKYIKKNYQKKSHTVFQKFRYYVRKIEKKLKNSMAKLLAMSSKK